MIQLTTHMRILVAIEPADFRKGIDGLAGLCRARLNQDPFQGTVFVFRNRRATAVTLLFYDGPFFFFFPPLFSPFLFPFFPPSFPSPPPRLEAHQLAVLLSGGDPTAAQGVPQWRQLDA